MLRNSLRFLGIVALAAAFGLPVSVGAQGNSGGGGGGGGPDWGPFQGLDSNGNHIMGKDESVAVAPGDAIYPHGADGNSTAPTWESVFKDFDDPFNMDTQVWLGPDSLLTDPPTNSLSGLQGSEVARGLAVVDGGDLSMQGNPLFIGTIVIRNCGTLSMGGNGNVYGAVIVDAVRRNEAGDITGDCGANYDPFAGNGTPAVRFSRAPLSGPPGTGPGGEDTGNRGVTIWNERLL